MVSCNIIFDFQRYRSCNRSFQRCSFRIRFDIRSSQNFYIRSFFFRCRKCNHIIMYGELFRQYKFRHFADFSGVSQIARHCGNRCQFRRYQINLSVLSSGTSEEVSVKSSQRNTLGIRRLSHTNTRTAGTFQNSCACINHDG